VHRGLLRKGEEKPHRQHVPAKTLSEAKTIIADKGGFVMAMWCGDVACELKMKVDAGVSSRCMPFEQEHIADTCVCCGKPAEKMVIWGVAY
jgi:prolyl-tRNA synthetase